MTKAKKKKDGVLLYKGRPFMRKDNLIYYGSMSDKYTILLQILETKMVGELEVASKVSIQLQHTAANIKSKDRVVKRSEKNGLWNAMDIATIWLERALASA